VLYCCTFRGTLLREKSLHRPSNPLSLSLLCHDSKRIQAKETKKMKWYLLFYLFLICAAPSVAQTCGNNIVEEGEECDDGNIIDNDGCTNACTNAVCGDGIVQFFVEACDDGNTVDGDGCDSTCQNEGLFSDLFGLLGAAGFTAGLIALGYLVIGLSTDLVGWITN